MARASSNDCAAVSCSPDISSTRPNSRKLSANPRDEAALAQFKAHGKDVGYGFLVLRYAPQGDLTKITDPTGGARTFTYDGSHRLTRDQYGPNMEANYAYTSYGTVGTITQGAVTVGGVTNPTRSVVSPVIIQGIGTTPVSGTVYGSITDALNNTRRVAVDARGRQAG